MRIDTKQTYYDGIIITPAAVAVAKTILESAFKYNVFRKKETKGKEVLEKMFPVSGNGAETGISTLGELNKAMDRGKELLSGYYSGATLQLMKRRYEGACKVALMTAAEIAGVSLLYPISRSL